MLRIPRERGKPAGDRGISAGRGAGELAGDFIVHEFCLENAGIELRTAGFAAGNNLNRYPSTQCARMSRAALRANDRGSG
jgi:hypothetical protein